MWIKQNEDRALLHRLSRDIVASIASEELDLLDASINGFFAKPCPPTVRPRRALYGPVAPAVVNALLTLLVTQIQVTNQILETELIKNGLRRLLRRKGTHPNETLRIKDATRQLPDRLAVIVYVYTLPAHTTVPITTLYELAHRTAYSYGLDDDQSEQLAFTTLVRLFCGAAAS